MEGEGFDYTWRQTDDFAKFLEDADQTFGALLGRDEFKTVRSGPVGPNAFPLVAGCLAISSLTVIGVGAARRRAEALSSGTAVSEPKPGGVSTGGFLETSANQKLAFACVIVVTGAYSLAADSIGFIPVVAVLLLGVSLLLKAPVRTALLLAVLASPIIYQIFTGLLRVPLPPGLLGW